ncbi:MAG TPA: LLM class F420-dependent oxidoreductase [Candidatus Acidoferrales bacterium]|nr:LLM class F420-dependent oxidoreductase [Candidatus Acidoferrales bacterium]
MKIGLLTPFTGKNANPAEFARVAESLGFESIWVPEHPALPANPKTEFPGGGPIPPVYHQMADQVVALSMAAAVTKTLKLATGICLVPEHEPIALANQLATLDAYSGGRLIFGIGAGWLREESELFGVDFPRRWTQTAELIAAMRALWREDQPSFEGKYVKFPPVRCYPKPAQKMGPPVHIGSLDKNALKRVAKWADGWCPIRLSAPAFKEKVDELRRECAAVGRDFSQLDITIMGAIQGDRAKVQDGLKEFAAAGAHRFVAGLGDFTPETYENMLKKIGGLYV